MRTQYTPGKDLIARVRAGFILKHTSLTRWCSEQQPPLEVSSCRQALSGHWNGPKAAALRARLIKAAGVKEVA